MVTRRSVICPYQPQYIAAPLNVEGKRTACCRLSISPVSITGTGQTLQEALRNLFTTQILQIKQTATAGFLYLLSIFVFFKEGGSDCCHLVTPGAWGRQSCGNMLQWSVHTALNKLRFRRMLREKLSGRPFDT